MKAKKEEIKESKTITLVSYADLISKYSVISAVQLFSNQKELSSELKSKVMDIRFALKKYNKDFNEMIKDGCEALKSDGFDERLRESQEFEENLLKKYPGEKVLTDEMLSSADLTPEEEEKKAKYTAFRTEYKKWDDDCNKFASTKLQEKIAFDVKKLTRKEYDEILNVNSLERYEIQTSIKKNGIMSLVQATGRFSDFMEILYEEFVE